MTPATQGPMRLSELCPFAAALALGAGCSAEAAKELPPGWESARPVDAFTQSQCDGNAYSGPRDSVEVTASVGMVHVAYHNAFFGCSKQVEGFVRMGPGSLDFLVQPVDMHPANQAMCMCRYEITMAAKAAAGTQIVTTYKRSDFYAGGSAPLALVGTATVTVP